MGKLFRGLAQGGSWVCLDEFNRIDIEVIAASLPCSLAGERPVPWNARCDVAPNGRTRASCPRGYHYSSTLALRDYLQESAWRRPRRFFYFRNVQLCLPPSTPSHVCDNLYTHICMKMNPDVLSHLKQLHHLRCISKEESSYVIPRLVLYHIASSTPF